MDFLTFSPHSLPCAVFACSAIHFPRGATRHLSASAVPSGRGCQNFLERSRSGGNRCMGGGPALSSQSTSGPQPAPGHSGWAPTFPPAPLCSLSPPCTACLGAAPASSAPCGDPQPLLRRLDQKEMAPTGCRAETGCGHAV